MARKKSLTKKQKLQQQYRQQIKRIEKNIFNIRMSGGIFYQSLNDIIKPVKNPTEATIRRLKDITKDDLYRLAKTETGESGWKIRSTDIRYAQNKARYTRVLKHEYKRADGRINGFYYSDFTTWRKEKEKQLRDQYEWEREHPSIYEHIDIDEEPEESLPETSYEEPVPEPSEEPLPETSYEEPDYGYVPDFSSETESTEGYDTKVEENIESILNDNQDTTFAKAIKNEFDKMKNNMSDSEFQEWLKKNGQKFLDTVEEVVKYEPKASHTGEGLNKFTQSMTMLNDGITPLDKFSAGNDAYYAPPDQYMEDYYEDYEEEEEDDSDLYVDRATGEIERLHKETYRQRIDKWGREHYNTEWFDENGLTVNISNYIPISQVKENEDYY